MPENNKKAVVLLSGGLDSATACAIAISQGFTVHALTIFYGQRHSCELTAAGDVAKTLDVADHKIFNLDLRAFGGSALTANIDVPKGRDEEEMTGGIPVTYVPARNAVFMSIALSFAEALGAHDIFVGVNAVDYSGYPDCRPEFVKAFQNMANLATKDGVEGRPFTFHAPLIDMTKQEIIKTGTDLGVDYGLTHSCYDPTEDGLACGECDSCRIRAAAFKDSGIPDPTRYK